MFFREVVLANRWFGVHWANLTRCCLAGVLRFLQHLEQNHPKEPIALLAFSSRCNVVVSFTTDHKRLRTSLYGLAVQNKGSLSLALDHTLKYVENTYKKELPCQVSHSPFIG